MTVVPIACQSEGALEVYIEPVLPAPHLVVVGRSPMAHTLADLARALGWRAVLIDGPDFTSADAGERSMVVVATQGHYDEEAVEQAVAARPAYLGLVGSQRRGVALLGYLAERGVPRDRLDKIRVPAGLDLGRTTHEEIAVAILAELVQLRASGALPRQAAQAAKPAAEAVDPVCGMTVTADASGRPLQHDGITYYFCSARLPAGVRERPRRPPEERNPMLIRNEFEVTEPVEKVWHFFDNIPQVAACLPGAELTEDLGDDKYKGRVAVRMGPVRLQFGGTAEITERDEAGKRVVVHASGAEEKGRGQASMVITATLTQAGRGTKVGVAQDLQLSGAAAQYGRGMISDVTAVLMRDFSANMQDRIERLERGESPEEIAAAAVTPAGGLTLGLRAAMMALTRVFRRFFMPYQPAS